MKIYTPVNIPQKDRQEIESLIEEMESLQVDFKRAYDNWGVEFLEGTEVAEEGQKLNRELAQFRQEYEELQNATIEYEIKELSEDKIEAVNVKAQQLRRRMEAIRNGE